MWSAAEPCRTRTLSLEMQEPPHPTHQRGYEGVLWRLGRPRARRRGQRQQRIAKVGPGNAHPWQSGADLSCVSPAQGGPSGYLRQPRPRWLSWSWVRPERALLTEETVEAPRVMRMRPLSSKRVVLLQAPGPWGVGGRV